MKRLSTLLLLLGLPAALHAQDGRPIELGLDAGVSVMIPDGGGDNVTSAGIPASRFRVGFFVSDIVALEPTLGFALVSSGGETVTAAEFIFAGLFHFTADPSRPRAYFRAGGGLSFVDVFDENDTQFGALGGIGVKLPAGDQFAVRIEGNFGRTFASSDRTAASTIQILVGFSFFTE